MTSSSFSSSEGTQQHPNHFDSLKSQSRSKAGSSEKQHGSNPAVRLGEYVRQREYSREKIISGQVKSAQLRGEEDPATRQMKFKKENVGRLYDKVIAEIDIRRRETHGKSQSELEKEERFMEQVLKMLVGTKPGDVHAKQHTSAQTSTVSTASYNVSNRGKSNSFLDKEVRIRTEWESTPKVLEDPIFKGEQVSDRIERLLDKYRSGRQEEQERGKDGKEARKSQSKPSILMNGTRMTKPPLGPKK